MKELGEYLKKTRIGNGVSLTEACEDLELSTSHLENIESGNVRAYKVVDEFNDFLFQHTSKISLDDIRSAQKKKESEEKKIKSPYTIEHKEKINLWPFVYVIIGVLLLALIIYLVVSNINKAPSRVDELKAYVGKEKSIYEFTN